MIAFASNSLLCRAALKQTQIDAASFTFVRILSGAVALWIIMQFRRAVKADGGAPRTHDRRTIAGNWISGFALFVYAAGFSFAYNSLSAGTGALLLFGAVQITMILWGFRNGERLDTIKIIGLTVALSGLVVLVSPGLAAPSFAGSFLMLSAGVAWGIYSLRGKSASDAIAATTGNFLRALPLAALVNIVLFSQARFDHVGIIYALISGAITSGLGYVIWYNVLSDLRPVRLGPATAATVQLSVPVLAATGGILVLQEPITLRYMLASVAVLGGIALFIIERRQPTKI